MSPKWNSMGALVVFVVVLVLVNLEEGVWASNKANKWSCSSLLLRDAAFDRMNVNYAELRKEYKHLPASILLNKKKLKQFYESEMKLNAMNDIIKHLFKPNANYPYAATKLKGKTLGSVLKCLKMQMSDLLSGKIDFNIECCVFDVFMVLPQCSMSGGGMPGLPQQPFPPSPPQQPFPPFPPSQPRPPRPPQQPFPQFPPSQPRPPMGGSDSEPNGWPSKNLKPGKPQKLDDWRFPFRAMSSPDHNNNNNKANDTKPSTMTTQKPKQQLTPSTQGPSSRKPKLTGNDKIADYEY